LPDKPRLDQPPDKPRNVSFSFLFFAKIFPMAKPHKKLKKANHGARPANSKARKAKRKHIKT